MKLGTKIIGIFLGAALAAGVSTAAVLQLNKRNIEPAKAESASFDFTSCGYFAQGANVVSYSSDHLYIFHGNVSGVNNPAPSAATTPKFTSGCVAVFRPAPGVSIQSVTIVATSTTYANNVANGTFANATATVNSKTVTIVPDGAGDFSVIPTGNVEMTSISYTYTGTPSYNSYQLVTDASQLSYGSKVVFASMGEIDNVTYIGGLLPIPNNNNAGTPSMPVISLSDGFNENSVLTSKFLTEFTLGGHPGAWEFINGSQKLSFLSKTSSSIKFTDSPEQNSNYQFNIESPNNGTNILVSGLDSFSNRYLRSRVYTSSNNVARSFYSNPADGYNPVYMFAQIAEPSSQVAAYAGNFLGGLSTGANPVCSADGNTDLEQLQFAWAVLASGFNNLSVGDQQFFTYGVADENGSDIQKTLALYDFIVQKYGTQLESENCDNYNFMGRTYSPSGANALAPIQNHAQLGLIILISAFAGASAVGVYFLIRKKKEQ